MELLLSACSTCDKKIVLPGKQKRAVYASAIIDSGKPKQSNFLPCEEWNKLTQDQKDVLIAKRLQERMGHVPLSASRQVNIHNVEDLVNLDNIIEYTSMNHDITTPDVKEDSREEPSDNAVLTFMAGRGSPSSPPRNQSDPRH
jgi:hypothetical protein